MERDRSDLYVRDRATSPAKASTGTLSSAVNGKLLAREHSGESRKTRRDVIEKIGRGNCAELSAGLFLRLRATLVASRFPRTKGQRDSADGFRSPYARANHRLPIAHISGVQGTRASVPRYIRVISYAFESTGSVMASRCRTRGDQQLRERNLVGNENTDIPQTVKNSDNDGNDGKRKEKKDLQDPRFLFLCLRRVQHCSITDHRIIR